MSGRFGTGLCIMLIDLNGFKQINDTRGHHFGDRVLKACTDRLIEAVRDTDLVGRWGGDEFVVLLPGLEDSSAVRASAERIGMLLSATPIVEDVSISGSVGAALYPRHGTTLEDLMHAADVAMYEAKTTGVVHRLAETIQPGDPLPPPTYGGPERRRTIAAAEERERSAHL
jgi:diguanylate cyclase (GGDEF)-like protein